MWIALDLEAVRRSAAAAGVTIHTLGTAGLVAGTAAEMSAAYRQTNTMVALALGTGGLRGSSNDLLAELRDVENASRSYYVLGYSPTGEPDGRYHPVKVQCRRRGSRVRSREAFIRFTPSEVRERTIKAAHVLPDLYRDVAIDLSIALGPVTGSDRFVDLVVHVPTGALLFLPEGGRPTARLEVGLVAFDEHGKESLRVARAMRIARLSETDDAGAVQIYSRAHLPDREQLVTAVVRDEVAGVVGAARAALHGSEIQPDAIQGLSLYSPAESSRWIEMPIGGTRGGEGGETHEHLIGPALKSTFVLGEVPVLGFRRPEEAPGSTSDLLVVIRRVDSIVRSIGVAPAAAGSRPAVKVPLPVQGLPPGEYTVAVQTLVGGTPVDRARVPLRLREPTDMTPGR